MADTIFDKKLVKEPDEPILKYSRVKNSMKDIIRADSISCITIHSKFMVIGTDWGNIHILDHMGYPSFIKELHVHSTVINQISIDTDGEHIASCSDDGKVMVMGLLDNKQYSLISFNRTIKAVAISPDFKNSSQFVTGDTRLFLVSKGILSTHKHKVLQENRSLIRNIKWRNNTIVYSTDDSVYVFDMKEQKLIGIIDPKKENLVSNLKEFYCRISWIDDEKFVIGWGHLVQIFAIKEKPIITPSNLIDLSSTVGKFTNTFRKIDSVASYTHPDRIIGVAPYDNYVLCVVYPISVISNADESEKNNIMVCILKPADNEDGYTELTAEQLALRGFEYSKDNRVHLEKIPFENEFYIASCKDLVKAREREIDDRIQWLIDNRNFPKAMNLVKVNENLEIRYKYKDVGLLYIDYLLSTKEFPMAAGLCKTILDDKENWENVTRKFMEYHCIEQLLPFIPTSGTCKMDKNIYMDILKNQFSYRKLTNRTSFLDLLEMWPPDIYDIPTTINLVLNDENARHLFSLNYSEIVSSKDTQHLGKFIFKCLAILYDHCGEYAKALECYLKLRSHEVFRYIVKRNLFDFANENMTFLMNYDKEKMLSLLMDNINIISPDSVVKKLSPTPLLTFYYLNALFSNNTLASEPYHSQMVQLYAEFKREHLMSFLRSSDKYDLNAALKLCQEKKFNAEVIYLLGRIGRSKEALNMIMVQQDGVHQAIEYCRELADSDLWQQLMKYSVNKPDYIKAILESTTNELDLRHFIKFIDESLDLPGLKDSLVKLLVNIEKEESLMKCHQENKWLNILSMLQKKIEYSTKPIICDRPEMIDCIVCRKSVVNCVGSFQLFRCSHFCHLTCFCRSVSDYQTCPVCIDKK